MGDTFQTHALFVSGLSHSISPIRFGLNEILRSSFAQQALNFRVLLMGPFKSRWSQNFSQTGNGM
jgi:hypothetical protein